MPYVIGLCGINTKIWHFTDLNVKTADGNLEAGARILRHYLDRSKEDHLSALWSYKGRGANGLGLRQAHNVMNIAKGIQ